MSDKEPHAMLSEWLLSMGYPKDAFPTDDELKTVCRGSVFRYFWKDVIKYVKPKQEVAFVRKNIFVKSIRRYERIEDSSKAKIGQVLPPDALLLWKKIKENEKTLYELKSKQETAEATLDDRILSMKLKAYRVNQLRKSIEDIRRKTHLLTETVHQLDEDIQQSKEITQIVSNIPSLKKNINVLKKHSLESDELADFLCLNSPKRPDSGDCKSSKSNEEHISDSIYKIFNENSNTDVEKHLSNVNVFKLFSDLMSKREAMIKKILDAKNNDENISDQKISLSHWKVSVGQLSLMHCNMMVAAYQHRTEKKRITAEFQNLLKKFLPSYITPQFNDMLKLKLKYSELNGFRNAFEEFIENLANSSGLFIGIVNEESDLIHEQSIGNLRNSILTLHEISGNKRNEVLANVSKISESVNFMREIKRNVLDLLGHNEFGFLGNESLNISMFNPNSTVKSTITQYSKHLLDAKHMYCETNANKQIKQDIFDIHHSLSVEVRNFKDFDLSRNRKIVLNNGEKVWCSEMSHSLPYFSLDNQYLLFKLVNPFKTTPSILNSYVRKFKWKKSLENLSEFIIRNRPQDLTIVKSHLCLDERSDVRIDNVVKSCKKSMKPLQCMDDHISNVENRIGFVTKTDMRKYISEERIVDGKTYEKTEFEIKNILLEESYWK